MSSAGNGILNHGMSSWGNYFQTVKYCAVWKVFVKKIKLTASNHYIHEILRQTKAEHLVHELVEKCESMQQHTRPEACINTRKAQVTYLNHKHNKLRCFVINFT